MGRITARMISEDASKLISDCSDEFKEVLQARHDVSTRHELDTLLNTKGQCSIFIDSTSTGTLSGGVYTTETLVNAFARVLVHEMVTGELDDPVKAMTDAITAILAPSSQSRSVVVTKENYADLVAQAMCNPPVFPHLMTENQKRNGAFVCERYPSCDDCTAPDPCEERLRRDEAQ